MIGLDEEENATLVYLMDTLLAVDVLNDVQKDMITLLAERTEPPDK